MLRRVKGFSRDRRANIVVSAALTLPFIALAAGFALDFAQWRSQDTALKAIADSAAVAAARDLMVGGSGRDKVQAVAVAVVDANMAEHAQWGDYQVRARAIDSGKAVEVMLTQFRSAQFAGMIGIQPEPATVTSIARMVGDSKICIIGLHANASSAIEVDDDGEVVAGGCAVYSNSTNPNGLVLETDGKMTAALICSAGGASVRDRASAYPTPTTDCPIFPDPLASRPEPRVIPCLAAQKLVLSSGVHTLSPGTYCGGIEIKGTASITLERGIYVMRGGPLIVQDDAQLIGRHVGFFFFNQNSGFEFKDRAVIDLGAPKDGSMASVLFWKERASMGSHVYKITTQYARMLIGTIYLPNGDLEISTNSPTADNSPWTAIIARRIKIDERSRVVLNTDYDRTDVPIPASFIDKSTQRIYLSN